MICKYCEKPFEKEFNNQVYCTVLCRTRMTKIKKRLRQMKIHDTLKPRTCKRCKKQFKHYAMKIHCKSCVEHLKQYPHHYRKETNVDT